jgi:hypothetical protein
MGMAIFFNHLKTAKIYILHLYLRQWRKQKIFSGGTIMDKGKLPLLSKTGYTRAVETVRFDCTVLSVHINIFTLQHAHLQLKLSDFTVQLE